MSFKFAAAVVIVYYQIVNIEIINVREREI